MSVCEHDNSKTIRDTGMKFDVASSDSCTLLAATSELSQMKVVEADIRNVGRLSFHQITMFCSKWSSSILMSTLMPVDDLPSDDSQQKCERTINASKELHILWYRTMGYPSVSHRWYTPPDGAFKCEPPAYTQAPA
ncbi:hypothetical protein AVEN_252915-1 [Araneus ventricosus]|uniref:Uncharacterized protein n=1 Tax=Araneus ventricosus TaxID=182803 RepID=A0A4Y2FBZ9_ARAVE|nr:hypothetical protein AVEN_252915-1 [Araneus ventricosus]